MKKLLIRLVALMVVSSLCFSLGFQSSAKEGDEWNSLSGRIETLMNIDHRISVVDTMVLRSSTDEELYLLLQLDPTGFAIYNVETGCFEEISLDAAETPYESHLNAQCYYYGPERYCFKIHDRLFDARTGDEIKAEIIEQFVMDEQVKRGIEQEQSIYKTPNEGLRYEDTFIVYISNANYFTSLLGNDFGNNTNGTCVAVASGILLRYYDYYISDYYVAGMFESGYGTNELFHTLLSGALTGGIGDAANTLNDDYFGTLSPLSAQASADTGNCLSVSTRVTSKIAQGKPLIGAMFTTRPGCPYNHAAVVYGYTITKDVWTNELIEKLYHCHFGWKNTERLKSCNYLWFMDDLYFP